MLEAINNAERYGSGDPQERDVIGALGQVAIHETNTVQHGACQLLAYLGDGYFKEQAGDPLQTSLRMRISAKRTTINCDASVFRDTIGRVPAGGFVNRNKGNGHGREDET